MPPPVTAISALVPVTKSKNGVLGTVTIGLVSAAMAGGVWAVLIEAVIWIGRHGFQRSARLLLVRLP